MQVPNGAQVTALLQGSNWWQVEYNGTVGFVDAGFLRTGSSPVPATGNAVVQTGNSGKLNLREQANSDARILARFENGTVVNVLQRGETWCYVQAGGQYGYMMTKYLSISGSGATKVVRNTNGGTYVNLRTAPKKTSSNVAMRVPDGAMVNLIAWGEEWSRVSYNGVLGYMMSWFLK